MLIICAHLQAVVLVNIRLKKKKSSLNFEIKNKALTSLIIKNVLRMAFSSSPVLTTGVHGLTRGFKPIP